MYAFCNANCEIPSPLSSYSLSSQQTYCCAVIEAKKNPRHQCHKIIGTIIDTNNLKNHSNAQQATTIIPTSNRNSITLSTKTATTAAIELKLDLLISYSASRSCCVAFTWQEGPTLDRFQLPLRCSSPKQLSIDHTPHYRITNRHVAMATKNCIISLRRRSTLI